MAKRNISAEIQELIYKDAIVVKNNSFTATDDTPMRIRTMESIYDDFEVNDIIRIPRDYQVLSVNRNEHNYLCIVVDVESIDGTIRKMRFTPNSLAKCIIPIDDAGNRLGKVKTTGTVAEWYATQGTIDHAMEILAGNEIIVMDKDCYTVKDIQTKDIITTAIYSFEWRSNTLRTTKENIKNQILSMVDYLLSDRLPKQTSKHLKENDECIIRFKFSGHYDDDIFIKQDYTLNNIKVQLPLDFEKNMDFWVSYIYKRRIYYVTTIFFEYKLDFYNHLGEHKLSLIDNYVDGHAFVSWK